MKREDLKNTIRMGLIVPASYFKRGAWLNVERVMEYLVNKGLVVRRKGDIKYAKKSQGISLDELAEAYYKSPFMEHMDEIRKLSADLHLPINSGELLRAFDNIKA